ncbi:type I toxin-antitoxin system Hok family toxin [Serratia fonticola]|nr:type I toxin-antitoxin system Hok family toxin [Serratia fonticola]
MKPQKLALMALIVVSIALLGALLLNKNNLCDVSFRSGGMEIVAHMAYETK